MLIHPTLDKLRELRLTGMQKALIEQMDLPHRDALSFDERFGLLVDSEYTDRENRRLKTRLKRARLRQAATIEDIDYRHPRGLDKSLMLSLAGCDWIRQHHNVIITGPTGTGKSYLACALGNKASQLYGVGLGVFFSGGGGALFFSGIGCRAISATGRSRLSIRRITRCLWRRPSAGCFFFIATGQFGYQPA